jgi:hypothetical protein
MKFKNSKSPAIVIQVFEVSKRNAKSAIILHLFNIKDSLIDKKNGCQINLALIITFVN